MKEIINYELIGIYKSASKRSYDSEICAYTEDDNRTDYKYLFATNWQQVEKHFNVRMY